MSWQAVAAGAGGGFLFAGPLGATVGGLAAWWATQPANPSAAPAAAAAPATSTVVALPLSPADSTSVSMSSGPQAGGAGAGNAGIVISMPIDNGSTAAAPAPVVTPVVMAPLTSLIDTGDQGGFTSAQVTAPSSSSTPSSIGIIATTPGGSGASAPPLLSIVPTPVPTPVKPVMNFPDPNLPENSGGFMPPNIGGAGGGLLIRPMNPVISAPVTTMPIIQRDTGDQGGFVSPTFTGGGLRPTTGTVVSAPRPVAPIKANPAVSGLGAFDGAFGDTAGGVLGDTLGSVGGLLLLGVAIYAGVNLLKA